jgi:hypothetical protein
MCNSYANTNLEENLMVWIFIFLSYNLDVTRKILVATDLQLKKSNLKLNCN